jgi:hypothetical protein
MSAGQITQGRRVYPNPDGTIPRLEIGDYFKTPAGDWLHRCPGSYPLIEAAGFSGLEGNFRNHRVTEHEDGTVSASPSIKTWCDWGDVHYEWHGYLELGVQPSVLLGPREKPEYHGWVGVNGVPPGYIRDDLDGRRF